MRCLASGSVDVERAVCPTSPTQPFKLTGVAGGKAAGLEGAVIAQGAVCVSWGSLAIAALAHCRGSSSGGNVNALVRQSLMQAGDAARG
jgi:hypothetical protein